MKRIWPPAATTSHMLPQGILQETCEKICARRDFIAALQHPGPCGGLSYKKPAQHAAVLPFPHPNGLEQAPSRRVRKSPANFHSQGFL